MQSFRTKLVSGLKGFERATAGLMTTVVVGALALSVAPGNASAAIGFVQGGYATPQSAQSLVSITFTSAQQVGDLNVVVVGWNDTTAAVSFVSDSMGNVYTL